ncbi:MAG: hypothetical protein ACXWDB_07580 [Aeromicrobium sp.]
MASRDLATADIDASTIVMRGFALRAGNDQVIWSHGQPPAPQLRASDVGEHRVRGQDQAQRFAYSVEIFDGMATDRDSVGRVCPRRISQLTG